MHTKAEVNLSIRGQYMQIVSTIRPSCTNEYGKHIKKIYIPLFIRFKWMFNLGLTLINYKGLKPIFGYKNIEEELSFWRSLK